MNLLITGAWEQAKDYIPAIEEMGHNVIFMQQEKDQIPCDTDWAEGVICNGFFLYHPIEVFHNLRFIQLTSAGFDRVPMDYIKSHGISVYNAKDVYSIPVAEHAVACALWFYRGLGRFRESQKEQKWEKRRDLKELNGKIVLILGCGSVGQACAKAFSSLGCYIYGTDKHIRHRECFSEKWNIQGIKSCLKEADIVIVSLPLTWETEHMLCDETLSLLKDGAILINISRGKIIDTKSLLKHIPRLNGVALDVFEEEPLPQDSPLWDFENVLITPHNSFVGDGNGERLRKLILNNLELNGHARSNLTVG